jgi:protein-tyrosine phosphatase
MLDLHCHILPGVDDGPESMVESVELARLLVEQGVTDVIATPHQLVEGPRSELSTRAIVQRVEELNQQLKQHNIPLSVHPGGEVRATDDIVAQIQCGYATTLCNAHQFLLLELPFNSPLPPRGIVEHIHALGLGVILAHPERYAFALADPHFLDDWSQHRAMFQLNASSVAGDHGSAVQQLALQLVRRGQVHFVASDTHGYKRPPRLDAARQILVEEFSSQLARQLCDINPRLILNSSPSPSRKQTARN